MERQCSRCQHVVAEFSPGRIWCRACENKRRKRVYQTNRIIDDLNLSPEAVVILRKRLAKIGSEGRRER